MEQGNRPSHSVPGETLEFLLGFGSKACDICDA
jgi:hypothetical protein